MTPEEKFEYYLRNNNKDRIIEGITMKHPQFEDEFNIVKEPKGEQLTLETGVVTEFQGGNMVIERANSQDDLDERFSLTFDDTYDNIQNNANLIDIDSDEKVDVEYRVFMESDKSEPAVGPIYLEGVSLSFNNNVATIEAQSPSLAESRTGEIYTYERFETLKAFLD